MIGLDTNILLRYLTQDDAIQSPAATHLIEHTLTAANPGYVSIIALAETVWTLHRRYSLPAHQISIFIQTFAVQDTFVLQHESQVLYALSAVEAGFGFADALAVALGNDAGCTHTLTFDRRAARLPGMQLI